MIILNNNSYNNKNKTFIIDKTLSDEDKKTKNRK